MIQTDFPPIIRSSKLHIQRLLSVTPMPDAVCSVYSCLTFIIPCIANIFSEHNKKEATFLIVIYLFISVRRFSCLRRVFRASSGAQNCTYSIKLWNIPARIAAGSSNGLTHTWRCMCSIELQMIYWKTLLKRVERLTEIIKIEKIRILLVLFWEQKNINSGSNSPFCTDWRENYKNLFFNAKFFFLQRITCRCLSRPQM